MKSQKNRWIAGSIFVAAGLVLFHPASANQKCAPGKRDAAVTTGTENGCLDETSPDSSDAIQNLGKVASNLDNLDLDGCGHMIKSKDEIQYMHQLDDVDEKYWKGEITAEQLQYERGLVRKRFNPTADPDLDKLLAIGITAADKQWVQAHIGLAGLDAANGLSVSGALKKKLMERSHLSSDQLDQAIEATAAPFKGFVKSLKEAGVEYNAKSHSWDISDAHFNVKDLQTRTGKTGLNTALGLFLSPDAMKAIADPLRQQPIGYPGPDGKKLVILPPSKYSSDQSKNGEIKVISQEDYNGGLKKALDQYKDARAKFIVSNKAESSVWNFVKKAGVSGFNLCWGEKCVRDPGKGYNPSSTAAEIENNKAYMGMIDAEHQMIDLGAPKDQLMQLQQDAANVMRKGGENLDAAVAKIDATLKAATVAEKALTYYAVTAGFGELASGGEAASSMKTVAVLARLARNGAAGFSGMAKFPIYLAGVTSAYNATVDTWKYGGGFMCHFAENLADRGPEAVHSAVKFGLMGAGGAAVGTTAEIYGYLGKGLEAQKAVEMGQQYGQGVQKAVGAVFSAQMIKSGATSLANCGHAIKENYANQDEQTQVVTSSEAWKTCGQAPIDAYFAVQAGKEFYHSAKDMGAGYKDAGVKGAAKAYFNGAPVVTEINDIDVSKPERVAASINAIAKEQPLFFESKSSELARRLAKEAKPTDLATMLKDPSGPVSDVAAQALSLRHDPESARILIESAEKSQTDSWIRHPIANTKAAFKQYTYDKTMGLVEKTGMSDKWQHRLLIDPIRDHVDQAASSAGQAKGVLVTRAVDNSGDVEAQKYLLKMAASEDPATHIQAIEAARKLSGSDQFTNILKKGLEEKKTQVVSADILSTYDTQGANEAVAKLIADTRSDLGKFVTGANSRFRNLAAANPEVLDRVVQNLRVRQDSEAGKMLEDATKSKDVLLRGMAKAAFAERLSRMTGTVVKPDLTKAELTAYNQYRHNDAKDRKKEGTYTVGDQIVDKKSGATYTLTDGGWNKNVEGGYYYVGVEKGTGREVWFTDADLKKGKSSVQVVKAPQADVRVADMVPTDVREESVKAATALALGSEFYDQASRSTYRLTGRTKDATLEGGRTYRGKNVVTGEEMEFNDDDLKQGKVTMASLKAAPAEGRTEFANGMTDEFPMDGADPETYAKRKSDPEFNKTAESVTQRLTKIVDKLSLGKKYDFGAEDSVIIKRVVEGLKPREIETLKEKLNAEPAKVEEMMAKAMDNCGKGAGGAAFNEWDPSGAFQGILYAQNMTACDL